MKHFTFLIITLVLAPYLFAQVDLQATSRTILSEAKKLYNSERASWNGTDFFVTTTKYAFDKPGGYFSYECADGETCLFYSAGDTPVVIATITYDSTFTRSSAKVDLTNREFTHLEKELYTLRKATLDEANKDTSLFRRYSNTNYNIIPLIDGDERKAYIITGAQQGKTIIFGNDYLLSFDKNDKLVRKKKLHNSLLTAEFGNEKSDSSKTIGGAHTHLRENDPFMTVTDLCTLMLYAGYTKWKSYVVVSGKYTSVWQRVDDEDTFVIIPNSEMPKKEEK